MHGGLGLPKDSGEVLLEAALKNKGHIGHAVD